MGERQHVQRLRSAGKAPKVALVACMHKVLTILNAIVKHRTPWRLAAQNTRQSRKLLKSFTLMSIPIFKCLSQLVAQ